MYNLGERKIRPGVYARYSTEDNDIEGRPIVGDIQVEDAFYLMDRSTGTAYIVYVDNGKLYMDVFGYTGEDGYAFDDQATTVFYEIYADCGKMHMDVVGHGEIEYMLVDNTTGKHHTIYVENGKLKME